MDKKRVKNVFQLLDSLKKIAFISNIKPEKIHYKIDSIGAVFLLRKNIRSMILKLAKDMNLVVEVKIRFCGVTIRSPVFKNCYLKFATMSKVKEKKENREKKLKMKKKKMEKQ